MKNIISILNIMFVLFYIIFKNWQIFKMSNLVKILEKLKISKESSNITLSYRQQLQNYILDKRRHLRRLHIKMLKNRRLVRITCTGVLSWVFLSCLRSYFQKLSYVIGV